MREGNRKTKTKNDIPAHRNSIENRWQRSEIEYNSEPFNGVSPGDVQKTTSVLEATHGEKLRGKRVKLERRLPLESTNSNKERNNADRKNSVSIVKETNPANTTLFVPEISKRSFSELFSSPSETLLSALTQEVARLVCRNRLRQRVWVRQPDVLAREPHQPPRDVQRALAPAQHACQPV